MIENTKFAPVKTIEPEIKVANYEKVNTLKMVQEPEKVSEKKVEMMADTAITNEKKEAALKVIGRYVRAYLERRNWIELNSNSNPYVTGSLYGTTVDNVWGTVSYLLRANPVKNHITLTIKASGKNLIHIVD